MLKLSCEPVLTEPPASPPEARSVFPALDPRGRVHVLMWDDYSIYPRQSIQFDNRWTPPQIASWLRELAAAVEGLGGGAQAAGGTAGPDPVQVALPSPT
jgi:hypothetical protein